MDQAAANARQVLDELGVSSVSGYLIRIPLSPNELARRNAQAAGHARTRRRRQLESAATKLDAIWRAALAAAARNELEKLQAIVAEGAGQGIEWCITREEAAAILADFYTELLKSDRPFDAYDFGIAGAVAWIDLWRD